MNPFKRYYLGEPRLLNSEISRLPTLYYPKRILLEDIT